MEGGTLMFNSKYKSLAAEWLGLSPDQLTIKDELDVRTNESKQEHVPIPNRAVKKKKTEQTKREKVRTSFEIGEKLQKKLSKARKRGYDREKEETARVCDKSVRDDGEEEESRSESVKKRPRMDEGKDGNRLKPLTIADLKTRLKDPTLSKPVKKKLRKRLRILEEKDGASSALQDGNKHGFKGPNAEKLQTKLKRKEIDEFSKSFTDHMKDFNNKKKKTQTGFSDKKNKMKMKRNKGNVTDINKSDLIANHDDSVSDSDESESGHQSPQRAIKSDMFLVDRSPVKKDNVQSSKKKTKKKTKSLHNGVSKDDEADSTKHKKTIAGGGSKVIDGDSSSKTPGRKRKRHKKRSKQKNIKKDHRPDEKKPAHLQGAGKGRVKQKVSSPKKPD
ncbi:DNA ligase 1-like [Haliotis cracherodii]|uniref:DNA ligase 1-like n=1 Tax=Haliotis cracherodii TaxID=6455 RepID=UPI0039ED25FE